MPTPILVESGLADLLEPESATTRGKLDSGVQRVAPSAGRAEDFATAWDDDATNVYQPGSFAAAAFHAAQQAPRPPARRTSTLPLPPQPLLDAPTDVQPLNLIDLEFATARSVGDPARSPSLRPISDGPAPNAVQPEWDEREYSATVTIPPPPALPSMPATSTFVPPPAPLPSYAPEAHASPSYAPSAHVSPLQASSVDARASYAPISSVPSSDLAARGSLVPLPIARPVLSEPPQRLSAGAWSLIAAATAASAIALGLLVLHYTSAARDPGQAGAALASQAVSATSPSVAGASLTPSEAEPVAPAVAQESTLVEGAELVEGDAEEVPVTPPTSELALLEDAQNVYDAAGLAAPEELDSTGAPTRTRRSAAASRGSASSAPATSSDSAAGSAGASPQAASTASNARDEQAIRAALALPTELAPLDPPAHAAASPARAATSTAAAPAPTAATPPAAAASPASTTSTPTASAATQPARPADAARGSATMGTFTVTSTPTAVVYIDGSLVGYTPLAGVQLAPGRHRVLLVRSDTPVRRTLWLNVEAGQVISRSVDLQTQ